jgi:hypothetical protein
MERNWERVMSVGREFGGYWSWYSGGGMHVGDEITRREMRKRNLLREHRLA